MNDIVLVTNGADAALEVGTKSFQFNDHLSLIRQLVEYCDACILVSPFLFADFKPLFDGLQISQVRVELISSCAPRGHDQLHKPFSLRSFGRLCKEATGVWPEIAINNSLHAKVYLFSRDGVPFAGIVTSANLTGAGLSKSHEAGFAVTDEITLTELITVAKRRLDYVSLTEYQIERLCNAADFIHKRDGLGERDVDVGLQNILNTYATPSAGNRDVRLSAGARYFIKVSGVRDRPILPGDRAPRATAHTQLDFAKSPDKIRIGDCLLEVAVGGKCFLPYYACASAPFLRSEQEQLKDEDYRRWPYYVFANNLALAYGASWFDSPLYYEPLQEEFCRAHPGVPVTMAGGHHLMGAIQMGNSYFQVTREFGEFVRSRIDTFKHQES